MIHIADFETSTGNTDGSTNVYLWGMKSINKLHYYRGVNLDEFFQCCIKWKVDNIWFHNLTFDGQFIVNYLIDNGIHYEDKPFKEPSYNNFTYLKTDMNTIYNIKVNIDGFVIKFSDTARLLVSTVDNMGKALGLPKLEIDYDKYKYFDNILDVPPTLLKYLERDIDIVIEFLRDFRENYDSSAITIGSASIKTFKKLIGTAQFHRHFGGSYKTKKGKKNIVLLDDEEYSRARKSYRGGLNVFKYELLGKEIKDIDGYSIDVNSMYPGIMRNTPLPYGKPQKKEPKFSTHMKLYQIYINKATLKEGYIPIIPDVFKVNGFEFRFLEKVSGQFFSIWEEELEIWKEYYDMEYDVYHIDYYRTKILFKEWVDKYALIKNTATNKVIRAGAKNMLNNHYGKYAERETKGRKKIILDRKKVVPGTRYGENYEYVETVVYETSTDRKYVPVASAITALSRVQLCKAIALNKEIFMYGDTDSIYCSEKPKGIVIDDVKFGAWKYEKRFKRFKYVKGKAYIADLTHTYDKEGKWIPENKIHVALAGLSKQNHNRINFNNFHRGYVVKKGKIMGKRVKGGIILHETDYTI